MTKHTAQQESARWPIRAGIIGAGLMGRWHAHALTRAGGRLVTVCDTDMAAAQRLAHAYRARAGATLAELLAHEEIDVLHICTPLATHADLAATALAAGAHVLMEKPLTPDAEGTVKLLAQAKACRRHILPVHQFIFQRGVQSALARPARLAPLIHLDVTSMTAGAEGAGESACDAVVGDMLPHPLALFQCFLPGGIDGVTWSVMHPMAGELRALGQAGEVSLSIHVSTRGRPTRNVFTVIGAHGSVQVDLFHGFAVFEGGRVGRGQKIWRPFGWAARALTAATVNLTVRAWRNEPAYPGLRELIRAFYLSIRDATSPPIAPPDILAVARAREQLLAGWYYGL